MMGFLGGVLVKGSLLLFLLGFGYLVFIKANKEEKSIRTVGRIIGIAITASALIALTLLSLRILSSPLGQKHHLGKKGICAPRF